MRAFKTIAINLCVFLVLAVVLELFFGYWFAGPDLGALNVKINASKVVTDSPYYPPGSKITYRRDRYGLRGNFEDPATVTILAVGGSTTNDRVSNEGDTWPDVLQKELSSYGKSHVVANAGIDGHSTVGHIRSFDLWFNKIPGLKPQFVTLYVGVNDIGVSPDTIPIPDKLESGSFFDRLSTYIKNHSALVHLVQVIRGAIVAREIGVVYEPRDFRDSKIQFVKSTTPRDGFDPEQSPEMRKRLEAYRVRLGILYDKVLAFGAKPVFITQPTGLIQLDGDDLYVAKGSHADTIYLGLREFNKVLMAFCHDVEAICVDLAKELKFDDADFYDNIHTTPSGSRKIGVYLAEKLQQEMP